MGGRRGFGLVVICGVLAASGGARASAAPAPVPAIVPKPVTMQARAGSYQLGQATRIVASGDALPVARSLQRLLRPPTGLPLTLATSGSGIVFVDGGPASLGDEGYVLDVTGDGVRLQARAPAGFFHGVQTLRQLLPPAIESRTRQRGPWRIPAVHVVDYPRFSWRGAQLDVARHFFGVADVERFVDLMALYKLNVLHLHLTDDQGWRIEIDGWPNLTIHGGSTEVGGGPGGYYTQADYRRIVAYAAARFIAVVPEIDAPGHVGAALASYPELNCDGKAPPLYTGVSVGFSSLCLRKPVTYRFLDDVLGQLAALTPGEYLDVGGDEANATPPAEYVTFVKRVAQIAARHGKRLIGWVPGVDAAGAAYAGEYWSPDRGSVGAAGAARTAVAQGLKLVLAPASRAYLDQKYDPSTRLGLDWAGYVSVEQSYRWDPATWIAGVPARDVLGVEAVLWSETLRTMHDVEYMALPRLPGIAEIGWSPRRGRSWQEYRLRLAAQGPRWQRLGLTYFRSPQVPWPGQRVRSTAARASRS